MLGLLALTTEEEPGIEQELLAQAGFTAAPGDFLHTLPGSANDPSAVHAAVTRLRTSAGALGIRIGIDPALAVSLQRTPTPEDAAGATQAGPALTTAVRDRSVPGAAPRPHPIR